MSGKSIEDLLRMVEGNKTPSSKPQRVVGNNKNVLRFVEELGLESGTVPVPSFLIFYYYRKVWRNTEEDKRYKTTKHSFFVTFHKHFVQHRKSKQRYYLLKEELPETTAELQKKANEYDRNYWGKTKKKAQEEV
jgi:predicted nucleotide-binding protein (sugar kinase/HSP70/actin superfamily)